MRQVVVVVVVVVVVSSRKGSKLSFGSPTTSKRVGLSIGGHSHDYTSSGVAAPMKVNHLVECNAKSISALKRTKSRQAEPFKMLLEH